MTASSHPKNSLLLRICVFGFITLVAQMVIHSGLLHFTIIHLNGVQEYREAAIVDTTHVIINGGSPYDADKVPTHTNVYGVSMSVIMAWISDWIDPNIVNHRIVSGIFIIGSCLLLFSIAKASGITMLNSCLAGLIFYTIVNLSYSILARPDGLGLFLMLGCIRLSMFPKKMSPLILVVSILLGCLAFFTKPYFIFGAGCAAVYLGWHKNMKTAVFYWIGFCFALFGFISLAKVYWPMYSFSTFDIHKLANTPDQEHFLSQWGFFVLTHLTFVAFIGVSLFKVISKPSIKRSKPQKMFQSIWNEGMQSVFPGHWSGFCSFTALLILGVSLAWHQGAYFIYFVHLASPFIIICGLLSLEKFHKDIKVGGKPTRVEYALVAIAVQVTLLSLLLRPLPVMDTQNYLAWKSMLDPKLKILAPPIFIPEMIDKKMEYPDNGQTEYFLSCSLGFPETTDPSILKISQQWLDQLRAQVQDAYYDRIIMVPGFFSHYFPDGTIEKRYFKKAEGYHYSYYGKFTQPWKYGDSYYPMEVWERKEPINPTANGLTMTSQNY